MSKESMKLKTEFNRYFTSMNGVDVPERVSVPRDEWRALFEALAEQPAQQEPVAGVVFRDGQPTLLQDKHIKETDKRLFLAFPPAQRKPLTLWTEAQHERAYRNSPDLHKDVKSLAAFKRVAKEIAAMYGIKENT